MALQSINPDGLPTPETYTHVVVATGSRLVFVAGQVAEDAHGGLVGAGDMAVQARQAFDNVGRALAAGGARPDQVAKLTIFVAGYRHEYLPAIEAGRAALFGDHKPADALIGVESLAHPGCLIEVEAIAVADDACPARPGFGVAQEAVERSHRLEADLPRGHGDHREIDELCDRRIRVADAVVGHDRGPVTIPTRS
jgi:enamine deaminase RidA (YjgF/YER057c/UK114 family)